ncbi:MAG: phosphate ABC transporter substrate-binding protein [Gammaproteobacteria bacterium]|nr:phosphate ABC transporter substrate-binding protein [Gammaproteobacteria bacterium]
MRKFFKTKTITAVLLMLTPLAPCASFAELVVIANRDLPISSLTQEEIYRIYLGKTKFLSNGVKVIPVDQQSGSPSRDKFYSDVIKKSDTEIKSYWSRVIFTGQGYPPIQESDDKAVRDLVAKNPNCMGYVDKSVVDGSVKIVYTAP